MAELNIDKIAIVSNLAGELLPTLWQILYAIIRSSTHRSGNFQ